MHTPYKLNENHLTYVYITSVGCSRCEERLATWPYLILNPSAFDAIFCSFMASSPDRTPIANHWRVGTFFFMADRIDSRPKSLMKGVHFPTTVSVCLIRELKNPAWTTHWTAQISWSNLCLKIGFIVDRTSSVGRHCQSDERILKILDWTNENSHQGWQQDFQ